MDKTARRAAQSFKRRMVPATSRAFLLILDQQAEKRRLEAVQRGRARLRIE